MVLACRLLQQIQACIRVLLVLKVFFCLVNIIYSQDCRVNKTTFTLLKGSPSGSGCETLTGTVVTCGIECIKRGLSQCKLTYISSCDNDGRCSCNFCFGIVGADFNEYGPQFFLYTEEVSGAMSTYKSLPGGLVSDQPLLLRLTLESSFTALKIRNNNDQALFIMFDFSSASIMAGSYKNDFFWADLSAAPAFSFTNEQEVSILILVTSTKFIIFIDNVKYGASNHVVLLEDITYCELEGGGDAKFVSNRRSKTKLLIKYF